MLCRERTQIALCRLGFVLACALPTLFVLGWAVKIRGAGHRRSIEAAISRELGLPVTMAAVAYPRSGVVRCSGVQLLDAESGKPLVAMPRLELVETSSGYSADADRIVASSRIARPLAELLGDRLRNRASPNLRLSLTAADVVWNTGLERFEAVGFKAEFGPSDDGRHAYATFHWRGSSTGGEKVVLRALRPLSGHAEIEAYLRSGDVRFPLRLLTDTGIDASALGPEAALAGSAWSDLRSGAWHTKVKGEIDHVRLDALLGPDSPHRLTGNARLMIAADSYLGLRGARVEQLYATLATGPGEISQSLLAAASRWLAMPNNVGADALAKANTRYSFAEINCRIALDASGLAIAAVSPDGVVLRDGDALLLSAPRQKLPVANLIAALSPPSRVNIPATPQAQRYALHLPAPRPVPANSATSSSAASSPSAAPLPTTR